MRDAFGIVVIAVSLVALVLALVALASSGRTLEQVGHGGLSLGDEPEPEPAPVRSLREEMREFVEARNRRRVAQGQEPLDVEAEVSRRLAELGGG